MTAVRAARQVSSTRFKYILFGKGSELFLAQPSSHRRTSIVLSVTVGGHELTDSTLNRDLRVTFPDRRNRGGPPSRRARISGMLTVSGDASAAAVPVIVRTSVEHYFEGASCRFRTTFEPTLEESM